MSARGVEDERVFTTQDCSSLIVDFLVGAHEINALDTCATNVTLSVDLDWMPAITHDIRLNHCLKFLVIIFREYSRSLWS